MSTIVGRIQEVKQLEKLYQSDKSQFIALYGRRRIGKTYLIRSVFKNKFTFQFSGLANSDLEQQLANFNITLKAIPGNKKHPEIKSWLNAFDCIKTLISKSKQNKKVIFIDELPWLDTPKSGFMQALESFWNSWASARKDVILIVCGSAASWMINELINNHGGLHNRVTCRMKIEPFTLEECEHFSSSRHLNLNRYQLLQLYMAFGGVPFYWDAIEKGKSATQIIDTLCFSKNGLLRTEFPNIFKSLFKKGEKHQDIIEVLAKKTKGLTRLEIIKQTKITNGGSVTRLLNELEESGFIIKYTPFGKLTRDSLYKIIDFYTLFYQKFIKNYKLSNSNYWSKNIDNTAHRAWTGYTFEQVCIYHVDKIKHALGISGVDTYESSWRGSNGQSNTQIDLVIDRRDGIINLCEMKYSINEFTIDKKYDAELRNKIGVFKQQTKTKKAIFLTLISTFGVGKNIYSNNIQNDLKMDILF